MNEITSTVGGPGAIGALRRTTEHTLPQSRRDANPTREDSVEISDTARFLSALAELPDGRARQVARVRAEILRGEYETPEKLDRAIEGLWQDL